MPGPRPTALHPNNSIHGRTTVLERASVTRVLDGDTGPDVFPAEGDIYAKCRAEAHPPPPSIMERLESLEHNCLRLQGGRVRQAGAAAAE